jgi:ribosome-associated protein
MDYVDFIVHVFSPEKRAFYGLERLRKSATTISVDSLNEELKASILAAREKAEEAAPVAKKRAVKIVKKVAGKKTATKAVGVKRAAKTVRKRVSPPPPKKTER